MEYRKSAILHFITILVLLALSICVLVFATNENKKLYKTGNTVVGSILVALMGLAMIPVVKMLYYGQGGNVATKETLQKS